MSPVEFKKRSCRPVEFKKRSCRPVEFKGQGPSYCWSCCMSNSRNLTSAPALCLCLSGHFSELSVYKWGAVRDAVLLSEHMTQPAEG